MERARRAPEGNPVVNWKNPWADSFLNGLLTLNKALIESVSLCANLWSKAGLCISRHLPPQTSWPLGTRFLAQPPRSDNGYFPPWQLSLNRQAFKLEYFVLQSLLKEYAVFQSSASCKERFLFEWESKNLFWVRQALGVGSRGLLGAARTQQ